METSAIEYTKTIIDYKMNDSKSPTTTVTQQRLCHGLIWLSDIPWLIFEFYFQVFFVVYKLILRKQCTCLSLKKLDLSTKYFFLWLSHLLCLSSTLRFGKTRGIRKWTILAVFPFLLQRFFSFCLTNWSVKVNFTRIWCWHRTDPLEVPCITIGSLCNNWSTCNPG